MKSPKQQRTPMSKSGMTPPSRYFQGRATKWMKEHKEKNTRKAELEPLIDAIFDEDYAKAKYHFSENVLKRLQGTIDIGARNGGLDMQEHIFPTDQ